MYAYQINTSTGLLTPVAGEPFQANAGAAPTCTYQCTVEVTADPLGRYLFYDYNIENESFGVGTMNVNAATGALTSNSAVSLSQPANSITNDPTGKYVYGYLNAQGALTSGVFGYVVGTDGSLSPVPGQPYSSENFAAAPSVTSGYLVAPEQNDTAGFQIDASTGALTGLSSLAAPNYGGAVVTPTNTYLYVSAQNSGGNGASFSIVPYKITGSGSGVQLTEGTPVQTSATNGFPLVMSPNGNFLYALTDTGVDDYQIDASTGNLILINSYSSVDFGSVAFDPQMKYVYAATASVGFSPVETGQIAGYSVNPTTGALTPISGSTITLPAAPLSVAVVAPQ